MKILLIFCLNELILWYGMIWYRYPLWQLGEFSYIIMMTIMSI